MFRFVLVATLAAFGRASYLPPKEPTDEGLTGGLNTTIEEHPYQLALLRNNGFTCSASLIKSNVALTAAHCTQGQAANKFKVRAGSTYHENGGELANVLNKCEHPKYQGPDTFYDYDVSVLLLDRSLPLSASIQPIALQLVGSEIPEGTVATVTGWGSFRWRGPLSPLLQKVVLPKVSHQQCVNTYGSAITERMACYGYADGGKGTCQGDSGAPIVVNGRQSGIVSWGRGCAEPGHPTVFSKISDQEIADHVQKCMAKF